MAIFKDSLLPGDFMDILIIEDDERTISDLKTILRKLGHNVIITASRGEKAIQYAGNLNPDLILISIEIRGSMSGVEVAKQLSDLNKIPIILLTVFIKNCLNKSLQLPEDAIVLSKPIKEEHLKYAISRAFQATNRH
jgi:two-component system, response regulator PdtaR